MHVLHALRASLVADPPARRAALPHRLECLVPRLLGVNAAGPVVCANVHWHLLDTERDLLKTFEEVMRQLGGIPHLGKLHRRFDADLLESWPQLVRFIALLREWDPEARFGLENALLGRDPDIDRHIE